MENVIEKPDCNEVIIQGPVVAMNSNDIATNMKIKVQRANFPNTSGDFKKTDVPLYNWLDVAFYDAVAKEEAAAFKVGDEVRITARVDVHHKVSAVTNENFYDQRISGMKVERAKPLLRTEFDLDVERGCEQFAIFKLRGEITRVSVLTNTVAINVRTFVKRSVNNVQTFVYTKNPEEFSKDYAVGDIVTVAGNIQTSRKVTDEDRTINRRNFIVSYIEKDTDKETAVEA